MEPYPHHYRVDAGASATGSVALGGEGLPTIPTAPPTEFGGPGDQWSPESLLVGAVVDCFVLTFRAIASASKLDWVQLRCSAEGTLDRVDHVTQFVGLRLAAELALPAHGDAEKGKRLLEKAEHTCLVTNSLKCPVELEARVQVGA